ncbi:hypothetical protein AVEN_196335-1 [Araneus ventricosus]|uniref:Mariner Mos1 transposase n=1 Tax=Araneus ventricosus TaxID=182803 RepID=A0A4Y2AWM0_ARAVE|nr:hypothetical protein AVEN_196335-1 [Araneus ventricosus]
MSSVILLHDNTHTARKTEKMLQKLKWEVWSHPPYSADLAPNLGSKHLPRTRFSSKSDAKTASENCGRDFHQAVLNKLVLLSDKRLNRRGDYVEK